MQATADRAKPCRSPPRPCRHGQIVRVLVGLVGIRDGLREFTLHVRYEEDFAVTADLASKITKVGLRAGGSFQRHQSTVWSITATFPPNQSRALRAIKHPFG